MNTQPRKRSTEQNSRLWAMLSDVAEQMSWDGEYLEPEVWKILFMDLLDREVKAVRTLDRRSFISVGRSSKKLTVAEMGDLMTVIEKFCAEHAVRLRDVP